MRITIEMQPPRLLTRLPRWLRFAVVGVVVVAAAAAVPTGLWASHQFGDVPDAQPFHDDIGAIKDAGITSGCGGGNYCPTQNVRRDAMAAFMHRGFGRVAMSGVLLDPLVQVSEGVVKVAEVSITVPGSGASATQFVFVAAQISGYTGDPNDCPCNIGLFMKDASDVGYASASYDQLPGPNYSQTTLAQQYVFLASPGVHVYELYAVTDSAAGIDLAQLALVATTYPFGSSGGNTLAAERTLAPEAAEPTPR